MMHYHLLVVANIQQRFIFNSAINEVRNDIIFRVINLSDTKIYS